MHSILHRICDGDISEQDGQTSETLIQIPSEVKMIDLYMWHTDWRNSDPFAIRGLEYK